MQAPRPGLVPNVTNRFALDVYLREYRDFLETERFDTLLSNNDTEKMYDTRNGFHRSIALRAWSRRWTHCCGRVAVLQKDDVRYVDIPFIRCKEEYGYTLRLAGVTCPCYSLSAEDLLTAGLSFIYRVQLYDRIYSNENLRHWAKEIPLER